MKIFVNHKCFDINNKHEPDNLKNLYDVNSNLMHNNGVLIALTSINLTYNTFYSEIPCNLKALSPIIVSMITGTISVTPTCYPVAAYVPSDGTLRIIFNGTATATTVISVVIAARSDFRVDNTAGILG